MEMVLAVQLFKSLTTVNSSSVSLLLIWPRHRRSSFNKLIDIQLAAGLNNVQLAFNETMSGSEGFSFDYGTASVSATPLPPTWTMMLIGLAGFGFVA